MRRLRPQQLASVRGAGPVSLTLDPNNTSDPCNPVVGLIDTGTQSLGSPAGPVHDEERECDRGHGRP